MHSMDTLIILNINLKLCFNTVNVYDIFTYIYCRHIFVNIIVFGAYVYSLNICMYLCNDLFTKI